MTITKDILILAKSGKHGDFCIAGKEIGTGNWIRPVSDNNETNGAITEDQARLTYDGATCAPWKCKTLRKVRINFSQHASNDYQPENYQIDNTQWIQLYTEDVDLNNYLDDAPLNIWGPNNTLTHQEAIDANSSLYLLRVNDISFYINPNTDPNDTRTRIRATFSYNGYQYDFPVTGSGGPTQNECPRNYSSGIFCISLGELYHGLHYKLIAAVYNLE